MTGTAGIAVHGRLSYVPVFCAKPGGLPGKINVFPYGHIGVLLKYGKQFSEYVFLREQRFILSEKQVCQKPLLVKQGKWKYGVQTGIFFERRPPMPSISSVVANSADICATLFIRLLGQGLEPGDVHRLVKDVYGLVRDGGAFTLAGINAALSRMGWHAEIMDAISLDLLMILLQHEFSMQIETHTVH